MVSGLVSERVWKQNAILRWLLLIALLLPFSVQAAPQKKLDAYWKKSVNSAQISVNHTPWQELLDRYVKLADGVHLFNYKNVTSQDRQKLTDYLQTLQSTNPHQLTRAQQFAYWVNLYNARTVALILENYPVSSIRKIGSVLSGPWDKKLMTVNGRRLSLNNIEHNILRPIFDDNRIHYVVNCASIGCPNLPRSALTASNYKTVLERAARDYVNHPRGVQFSDGKLQLSSIYKWYQEDFGADQQALLEHLATYAKPALQKQLRAYNGSIRYAYNWDLNES